MQRLINIDILKGIAIILVIMGHLYMPWQLYTDYKINQFIYSFHMPLFFFLSGYVFPLSIINKMEEESAKIVILKKSLGLLVPYFFFGLFYCLLLEINPYSLYFYNELHNGYWFTFVLFEIIIVAYFIQIIINKIQKNRIFVDFFFNLILIVSFLLLGKYKVIPETISTVLSTDKVFKFYLFFQMGKYVYQNNSIKMLFSNMYVVAICFIVYCYALIIKGYPIDEVTIWSFICPITAIVVIFNVVTKYQDYLAYKNIFPFLGSKSLDLYLIHTLFLGLIPVEIINSWNVPYLQFFVLLFCALICAGISLIISWIISSNEVLSLLLLGKGVLSKRVIDYVKRVSNK